MRENNEFPAVGWTEQCAFWFSGQSCGWRVKGVGGEWWWGGGGGGGGEEDVKTILRSQRCRTWCIRLNPPSDEIHLRNNERYAGSSVGNKRSETQIKGHHFFFFSQATKPPTLGQVSLSTRCNSTP